MGKRLAPLDQVEDWVRVAAQNVALLEKLGDAPDEATAPVRFVIRDALLGIAEARREQALDPTFTFEPVVVPGLHPVHLPEDTSLGDLRRIRACVSLDG